MIATRRTTTSKRPRPTPMTPGMPRNGTKASTTRTKTRRTGKRKTGTSEAAAPALRLLLAGVDHVSGPRTSATRGLVETFTREPSRRDQRPDCTPRHERNEVPRREGRPVGVRIEARAECLDEVAQRKEPGDALEPVGL